MAARGLVNGRGPRRRRGRDSAKRVVLSLIPLNFFGIIAAITAVGRGGGAWCALLTV